MLACDPRAMAQCPEIREDKPFGGVPCDVGHALLIVGGPSTRLYPVNRLDGNKRRV